MQSEDGGTQQQKQGMAAGGSTQAEAGATGAASHPLTITT